jgi:hypothetical protein
MCGVRGSTGCVLGLSQVVRKRRRGMVCVAISMVLISFLKTSVWRARLDVRSGAFCLSKERVADLA